MLPSEQSCRLGKDTRHLVLWTCGSHAVALVWTEYEAVAAGLPLLVALGLLFAAIVVEAAFLVWRHPTRRDARLADLYFWTYGAAAFLFASSAGAAVAVLALVASPDESVAVSKVLPPGLIALAMFDLYQALEAVRDARGGAQARLLSDDPVRATVIVMLLASALASAAVAIAIVLAVDFELAPALTVAAIAVVIALAVAMVRLGQELRQRFVGAAADDALRRRLLVALDKVAMQTGAVREITSVEVNYIGPAALRAILHLDFKDGVSAQHIGPVLERLRSAAAAEVPEVVDIVLAPASPRAS